MRLLVFVAAVLVVAAGCGESATSLTDADTGSEVELATGEQLELRLESNPSTGYSWKLDQQSAMEFMTLLSKEYEAPDESDIVGAAGIEVFTFEAVARGSGILRLEYIREFDEQPIPDKIVEYIIRIDGAPFPPPTTGLPTTATATAPSPTETTASTTTGEDVIDVSALFDGEGPRQATVSGYVVWDTASARLCEVLLESFPPQCGALNVVIANPEFLDLELESAQGVRWTDKPVEVAGLFDGNRFVLDAGASSIEPTETDEALVEAFLAHASAPTTETAAALPLASEVALGLHDEIVTTVPADQLGDAAGWQLDVSEYAGFGGPFSALDLVEAPVTITVGAHPHCAGPPLAPPAGFDDARLLSIQPESSESCIDWWSVDFFVDTDGEIQAITLGLFGP